MRCVGSFGHVLHMCLARESTACRDRVHRGLPYMTSTLERGGGPQKSDKRYKISWFIFDSEGDTFKYKLSCAYLLNIGNRISSEYLYSSLPDSSFNERATKTRMEWKGILWIFSRISNYDSSGIKEREGRVKWKTEEGCQTEGLRPNGFLGLS